MSSWVPLNPFSGHTDTIFTGNIIIDQLLSKLHTVITLLKLN